MTAKTDYRHTTKCDQCGAVDVSYSDEGEDEGTIPDGWAALTINRWNDGKPKAQKGNEDTFAELCSDCLSISKINFHTAEAQP